MKKHARIAQMMKDLGFKPVQPMFFIRTGVCSDQTDARVFDTGLVASHQKAVAAAAWNKAPWEWTQVIRAVTARPDLCKGSDFSWHSWKQPRFGVVVHTEYATEYAD